MLGTLFVEDGVGVVDVNQDSAGLGARRELREQAIRTGERKMADFARGFFAAARSNKFVVGPKRAVEESHIRGSGMLRPLGAAAGEGRSDEERFAILLEGESDAGVVA